MDNEKRNIARYFVENRHVSWVLLVAVLAWGVFSYRQMPQRKDPNIPVRVAAVMCAWPGMRAEKVEELLARPIEQRIAENDKVERVESTSRTGMAILTIKLRDEIGNTGEVFDDINLKLLTIGTLPEGAGPINFLKDFGDTATLMLTVASPKATSAETSLRAGQAVGALERLRAGAVGRRLAVLLVVPDQVPPRQVGRKLALLERFLAGTPGMVDVRVAQESGLALVDVATDMDTKAFTDMLLNFADDQLRVMEFHPDVWPPVVVADPSEIGPKLAAAPGDKYGYRDLEAFTDTISRTLLGVFEVSRVTRWGVMPEVEHLSYSQERLASYGVQPWRIKEALTGRNIVPMGGVAEFGGRNVVVDPSGEYATEQELGATLIARNLPLRDLVDMERGYENPPVQLNFHTFRTADGQWNRGRAITLAVTMRTGEQIGRFSTAVATALEGLSQRLPEDIVISSTSDQPRQVRESVNLFMNSLYEAVLLVVLVAFVGFREWRSAMLMALSIPVTLAMTFGMMHTLGIDLQQISIASLIIALGLLVDDPVVAGDAIKRELAAGIPRSRAAWMGPTRLAKAILYATITNIVAYLPFLMLSGDKGRFLFSLPVVVTCSLIASRVVSMTFIPLLGYYLLQAGKLGDGQRGRFARLYYRLGEWLIENRLKALAASLVLVVGGLGCGKLLKPMFFPIDLSYLSYVDVWLPEDAPATRTAETAATAEAVIHTVVERFAKDHPEYSQPLVSLTSFVGASGPRFWFSITPELRQPNYAQILVQVSDNHITGLLCPMLQEALSRSVPGARLDVRRLESGPPIGIPLQVRLSGEDEATLRSLAGRVKALFTALDTTERVRDNWGSQSFTARLAIDPDKANLAGVTNQDVSRSTALAISGQTVSSLREGRLTIPVELRLRAEERSGLSDLSNLYVYPQSSDHKVPLAQVADISFGPVTEKIVRRNHFRTITVSSFTVAGVLPSEVTAVVLPALETLRAELPPGYRMEIGGEYEEQVKGFAELAMVMAASVAMIYLALLIQFRSAVKPFIVFGAIPYGVAGALACLAVMGSPFGFMAFLGVASLIGVIVSHIIVLFDCIEEKLEAGEPLRQAILDAGLLRLRPVMITVGATVTALFPLAAHGGPLWEPMCYAQIGGLMVATFVTLLMVPVLYSIAAFDLKVVPLVHAVKHPDA